MLIGYTLMQNEKFLKIKKKKTVQRRQKNNKGYVSLRFIKCFDFLF